MNRSQEAVLVATLANLALMLLFPPYDAVVIGRGVTSFDAFHFILDGHPSRLIDWDLLWLELYWLLINAGIAWMLLRGRRSGRSLLSRRNATLVFIAVNLALIFLFPPFENYGSALKLSGTYFDGFYFSLGDKLARRFYWPLLSMEVLWLSINGAALWLAFRERPAGRRRP